NDDVVSLKSDLKVVSEKINQVHKNVGHVKTLIDISNLKTRIIGEAIEALIELAKRNKDLVDKTAVLGGSEKLKIVGETIAALSGRENIKFFDTKEQAIDWLNK
ncbi:MAG TPA: STAS/SEC14 domain-containing protein, partial [Candidatus Paceibacterota bacterium]